MKKVYAVLLACLTFLFSCNVSMFDNGNDTDLVIMLPGSEEKAVDKYSAGEITEYRIDLIHAEGTCYTERGDAGGACVFKNIRSGSYTLIINGLVDGMVASKYENNINVFPGEENFISAKALLQYRVTDFFMSVSKGVWNKNCDAFYSEKEYYEAVRDVSYGVVPDRTNDIKYSYAEIINPEVDYAYLNFYQNSGRDFLVNSNTFSEIRCSFCTEKKGTISITVLDRKTEEIGPTRYYEYDPVEFDGMFAYIDEDYTPFVISDRPSDWSPIIRIGFPKECGKIYISGCGILAGASSYDNDIVSNTAVLPEKKELVQITKNATSNVTKIVFDKRKIGSNYAAALFTGMQPGQNYGEGCTVKLEGLTFSKPVKSLNVEVKSYATKKKLYESKLKNFQISEIQTGGYKIPYSFKFLVPKMPVYENEYEGAYLEIHPEGWDGDVLEMEIEKVICDYNSFSQSFLNATNCLLMEYRDLKDRGVDKAPVYMFSASYDDRLCPNETKVFSVSAYPMQFSDNELVKMTSCLTGQPIKSDDYDFLVPYVIPDFECNVPGLTCSKTEDGKICLKNNTQFDTYFKIDVNDARKVLISTEENDSGSFNFEYKTFDKFEIENGMKKAKIGTINYEEIESNTDNTISLSNISFIPVVNKGSDKKKMGFGTGEIKPFVEIVVKTKSGNLIAKDILTESSLKSNQVRFPPYDYLETENFNEIITKTSYAADAYYSKFFNEYDSVIEIYLCFDENEQVDRLSIYQFRSKITSFDY